ncbi:MAG: Ig-like domain-containing protein [Candidatus Marinimicrobia bacterium]|nr:Ig-like domain-containing protein [Candidatus Neomarinimicrobiota bacterium]MBL7011145.1 Ig-like domain-containing protein [Candidatus Neomarinimicrobiota bacterium]MBL7031502.1 Ig-like domain-containing protein [Candidatus Neomarinimicrobiota bacterium]
MNKTLPYLFISLFILWSCEDKRTVTQEPETIVISPLSQVLQAGQTVQLNALVIDKENMAMDVPVTWSSTNEGVATITKEGLVTGIGQGVANIYATVENIQGMSEIIVTTKRRRVLSEMFTSST